MENKVKILCGTVLSVENGGTQAVVAQDNGITLTKGIAMKMRNKLKEGDRVEVVGEWVMDKISEITTETKTERKEGTQEQGTQENKMSASDEFLRKRGVKPRISFRDGEKHEVTIIKDEISEIETPQGEKKEGIEYTVIENNEEKTFFTTSIGLISGINKRLKRNIKRMTIQMIYITGLNGTRSHYKIN